MKLTGHKGRYLKAIDAPKPILLTIKDATHERMEDGEHKDVIWFEEAEAGLVLNKVNTVTLVEIAGTDDSDQMIGTKVVIFKTTTEFSGKQVDCLRLRAPKVTPAKEPEPPAAANGGLDDIPF